MSILRDITIEPGEKQGEVIAYEHGTYGPDSVLEGQSLRCFLDSFASIDAALAVYPYASVLQHSTRAEVSMSSTPPSWFDPFGAGERW